MQRPQSPTCAAGAKRRDFSFQVRGKATGIAVAPTEGKEETNMLVAALAPLLWALGGLVTLALVRRERIPPRAEPPAAAFRPAA